MSIAEAILKAVAEAKKEDKPIEELLKLREVREVAEKAREKLSETMRAFWNSPEGRAIAALLSYVAHKSGYAKRVQEIMEKVADELETAAAETGISAHYKQVWGKTP